MTVVQRSERIAARRVGAEMVVLSADDSSLFVLNEVGTIVWEAADGATSTAAIAEKLCREYEVDIDTARRDVEAFVEALTAAGVMMTSVEAPS